MVFDSLSFAFFLPIVFIVYWAIPHKFRWAFILAANCCFYMSGSAGYVLLLLLTILITYTCGMCIEKSEGKKKKFWLLPGIITTLGSLFFFKYFTFTIGTSIIIPLGISFYTFKEVSYIIDVYRGKHRAERHLGYYAAFISYFPDVISGPIDRAEVLLPQLKSAKTFRYEEGVLALRLMLLGFAKKILLADVLTRYTDVIFNDVTNFTGFTLVLASLLYTIQIYCDFSGYSDIAMGVSKLFGINLMQNFNLPYLAKSIKEFWSRWHISLSTWFRDYVYIPLGGNRVSRPRRALNLMITFLVSGAWHGANYTYILWGALHGFYQVIENWIYDRFQKTGGRIKGFLQTCITFSLVSFAWIFFRSDELHSTLYFITHMFSDFSVVKARMDMGILTEDLWQLVILIPLLMLFDYFSQKRNLLKEMDGLPLIVRWLLYLLLTTIIIIEKIHNGTSQAFIYFQF